MRVQELSSLLKSVQKSPAGIQTQIQLEHWSFRDVLVLKINTNASETCLGTLGCETCTARCQLDDIQRSVAAVVKL